MLYSVVNANLSIHIYTHIYMYACVYTYTIRSHFSQASYHPVEGNVCVPDAR